MSKQTLLLIVLILAVIAGSYIWYTNFLPSNNETSQPKKELVSQEFLARAAILDRIRLRTDFFSSDEFLKLQDGAKKPQIPENKGRANPFSPF